MRNMFLTRSHIMIMFEEFHKIYDTSYKFISTNTNEIKIYTPWSILSANFFINKRGQVVVILSNNWCSQDKELFINCITSSFRWEYIPEKSNCYNSKCCYIFFPLCYSKLSSEYNTKLVFEL